jgi:hypothetical protein
VRITEQGGDTVDMSLCVLGPPRAPRQCATAHDGCRPVTPDAAIHPVPRRDYRYCGELRRPRFRERRPTVAPRRDARSLSNVREHAPDRTVISAAERRCDSGAPADGRDDGHHDRPVSGCLPTYLAIGRCAAPTSAHATRPAIPGVRAVDVPSPMRGRCSTSHGED